MAELYWTGPALNDLRAIDRYLTAEADGVTASRQLAAILQRAERLTDFPNAGPAAAGQALRRLRVLGTPYTLLYRVEQARIVLLRIAHERQDVSRWTP